MIWIPGVDEIPMSLSMLNPRRGQTAITAERIGYATDALHKMKIGDLIGIRGPLGNCYTFADVQKALIVGGGTGLASLAPLTEKLVKKRTEITLLIGAKTKSQLLFHSRVGKLISKAKGELIVTTEDGSFGQKGLVTTLAERLLNHTKEFDMIYTCGPEKMMQKMFFLAEKFHISLEASLERFMRCAIGLCGTCVIGKYRVCQDGPVFSSRQLREVKEEFGQWRRTLDGRKTKV